jgi:hypothetical protein
LTALDLLTVTCGTRERWLMSRILQKLFATRVKLPSGRNTRILRMNRKNVADLRAALPFFKTDLDASSWLANCLATNDKGERLSGISASDEAELVSAIFRTHGRIYGVPLFARLDEFNLPKTRSDAASDSSILEFLDRYVASEDCFAEAALLGYRCNP